MRISGRLPAVFAGLAGLTLLTACSSGSSADSMSVTEVVAAEDGSLLAVGDSAVGFAGSAANEQPAAGEQSLVVTGFMTITVDDPIEAAERASTIVAKAGGRVDTRDETAPREGSGGSSRLTLRVPAAGLDAVRGELGELGKVDETSFSSVDVGIQVRDLDTRITTLRASIARYTEWLAGAEKTSDLIELESAIAERQNELESLEAQQRELADQVALSSITLELRSVELAPDVAPKNFGEGVVLGWEGFTAFWAGVVVVLGVAAPWLLLVALVLAVTVWLMRRRSEDRGAQPPAEG